MQVPNAQGVTGSFSADAPGADVTASSVGPSHEGLDLDLDGRLVLDAQWNITEVNARALVLLNCRMRALHGFDLWDVVPDGVAEQFQAEANAVLASSPHHSFVATINSKVPGSNFHSGAKVQALFWTCAMSLR